MEEFCTGGDVVVQALKAVGAEYVFGIISIHNIPIYDALSRQGGIRPIVSRSEPGAVNMADGYARATLRASMERDALLVADVTIASNTWASRLFPVYGPQQYIHAAGGGIGQGMQMGIGAKLGQPELQVVVIVGDGGFQVNMAELGTAAQEGINVVIVLLNDGGYGVLHNIQDRAYEERHIGIDLHGLNFEKLSEAYGIAYYPVKSVAEFRPAVKNALESGQLSLKEVGPFRMPFAGFALSDL